MRKLFGIALLMMVSIVGNAQEGQEEQTAQVDQTVQVKVVYSDFTSGTVEATAFDGQKVIITVTPDEGYYIGKDDIEVIAVMDPASATRGDDATLPIASALELTLVDAEGNAITDEKGEAVSDPEDLTVARCYAFVVPEGLGAWVRTATFHEVLGTHLDIDENTTELDAEVLSAYPGLKTISIKNAEQVIGLGNCDVTGLSIDVPGNLYNEYLATEGWDKAKEITCETGVEMTGVAFGDNNSYDTFVSSVALRIPSVLNAFVITGIKDGVVVLEEITDGIIPAGVPVLLLSKAHKGVDFRTALIDKDGSEYKNILLAAGVGGQTVKLGEVYLLYNDVFYLSQAGTIPEGGVYLPVVVEKEQGDPAITKVRSYLTIGGINDGTTAIDASRLSPLASELSDAWYTLDGRRLAAKPAAKGIYIFAGKMVVVK